MEKRTTGPARALAALALVAALMAVVLVFTTTLGGGDDDGSPGAGAGAGPGAERGAVTGQATPRHGGAGARTSYVVQNGDTLTSIAAKTGVSIERIQALNPGVDPQILVSGQKLKLR